MTGEESLNVISEALLPLCEKLGKTFLVSESGKIEDLESSDQFPQNEEEALSFTCGTNECKMSYTDCQGNFQFRCVGNGNTILYAEQYYQDGQIKCRGNSFTCRL